MCVFCEVRSTTAISVWLYAFLFVKLSSLHNKQHIQINYVTMTEWSVEYFLLH